MKMNEEHFTFHLQNKYSGTFANLKYEELLYPKNPQMCDPIPAAHPHKEVPPPPPPPPPWVMIGYLKKINVLYHFLALFMGSTTL